jgi:hypothetical protein
MRFMSLDVFTKFEATVPVIIEMLASVNLPGTHGVGDFVRVWEGIQPKYARFSAFDNQPWWQPLERKSGDNCPHTLFNGENPPFNVSDMVEEYLKSTLCGRRRVVFPRKLPTKDVFRSLNVSDGHGAV